MLERSRPTRISAASSLLFLSYVFSIFQYPKPKTISLFNQLQYFFWIQTKERITSHAESPPRLHHEAQCQSFHRTWEVCTVPPHCCNCYISEHYHVKTVLPSLFTTVLSLFLKHIMFLTVFLKSFFRWSKIIGFSRELANKSVWHQGIT